MGDVEFLTIAFGLACTLGPMLGGVGALLYGLYRMLMRRGWSITLIAPERDR